MTNEPKTRMLIHLPSMVGRADASVAALLR